MRRTVKKLVLNKETILRLQDSRIVTARGGAGQAKNLGDGSWTDCNAISCIGVICMETDAPCLPQTA
jgi:hypothetical protein